MAEIFGITNTDYVDTRAICPNTGEYCVSMGNLVELYDTHVAEEICDALPDDDFNPRYDQTKLKLKLAEYSVRAKFVDCSDADETTCPVRESMNESTVRVGVVKALRKTLRRKK
jgi:hypothetical protein